MLLEVIATNVEDAIQAQIGGADRIELIAAFEEGGLTPPIAIVEAVVEAVEIPVHVMIRPHSRSFVMDDQDIRLMTEEVKRFGQTGAASFVFGALTPQMTVDTEALERLLEATSLPITFHRAFDEVRDQEEALRRLLSYKQIGSILTSGGKKNALEAVVQISKLVELSRGYDLQIMAGSGLTLEAVKMFVLETQVSQVHFGSGVRLNNRIDQSVDAAKVKLVKNELDWIDTGTTN
ncbi:copper homeostasis protein CutC [Paenibacillus sp. SYP-B3998]|uniref:PF03932 family protein CutC n=1 Tax=Paenibacillus sp. SYP-B3998 TaxID=2678564 RepID=A0A6G3ZX08_9BACL|nr:copper homeostasis protein CutC [Paenibacillus sp. SYP-B3998]NEW06578.1 copper homeostasis protein CutC [Paenibacillus sp. SYP-B3998]